MVVRERISAVLDRLRSLRILVIGDLMLDHYIWGEVHRISPEAPVPVVHVVRETYRAGGAANVALNLSGLGVRTTIIGHLGQDAAGEQLQRLLDEEKIGCVRCQAASAVPTIVKTRVIAQSQQLCRIDREAAYPEYGRGVMHVSESLREAIEGCDAVILSDYAKGVVQQCVLDEVIQAASGRKILVAVDPKPSHGLNLCKLGLLTPNRHEALQLAGIPEPLRGSPYPLQEIASRIHERWAPRLLIVTLGAEGMAVCSEGQIQHRLPTRARQVFDVSGAGDTVVATLTAALAAELTPLEAADLANCAAGIVVSQVGTVHITASDLLQYVTHF